MSGYIGVQPVPKATQRREYFTATNGQTSFSTSGYTPEYIDVYMNGVKLSPADFTATNGSDVVLGSGAATGDLFQIISFLPFNAANQTFTGATIISSLNLNSDGATVTGIKDEDNMASNDANKLATQQSIKAYVDATNTIASAALPKAGGAMTGAITTNSTFDGVDIATRDAVLTSTTTTANAALPKAGGTMTGSLGITTASTADTVVLTRGTTGQNNILKFKTGSADKWIVGQRNDSTDYFRFYSYGTSSDVLSISTLGNVGIGDTSPDNKLTIRAASTIGTVNGHIMLTGDSATNGQGPQIVFSESGGSSNFAGASVGYARTGSNGIGDLIFGTRATSGDANTVPTERVRIDSSGVVRIGGQTGTLKLGNDGTYHADIEWEYNNSELAFTTNNVGNFTFNSNGSERMRIDSSGNVLVGKDNTTFSNAGIALRGTVADFTRDGGPPINVNRLTSDGTLIVLHKDGANIGSIGSAGGGTEIFISGTQANTSGIYFANSNKNVPMKAGAVSDGTQDIGMPAYRWKDIYTSGGVFLGGTGAANKLEDYEEGTWTASMTDTGGSALTMVARTCRYTKIGRSVHIYGVLQTTSLASASGSLRVHGLPFSAAADWNDTAGVHISHGSGLNITAGETVTGWVHPNSQYFNLHIWNTGVGTDYMQTGEWSANGHVFFNGHYSVS